jgi:hypothetical protein
MTGFTQTLVESCSLAGVLAKRGVKVEIDSITLTGTMGTSDTEGGYSTLRYADPETALASLVTKINTITNSKALNMIDVSSGYGGNSYIGQLLYEKD